MPFHSMRTRLTRTLTLSTALLMLIVCGGLSLYTRYLAERNADALVRGTANQIRLDLVGTNANEEHYTLREVIEENRSRLQANNLALAIYGPKGEVLRQSQTEVPLLHQSNDALWRAAAANAPGYTIVVGLPWRKTLADLQHLTFVLALLGLFVTLLSSVGAWWLVGRTLSPIHALSLQANEATAENLQLRLEAPSRDAEILELVGTLNALLERVAQAVAGRSRFYASASHELRTPLYVLSGSLEVALSRDRSREEYRESLQVAHTQARQLTTLIQDLLCLNQLDFLPAPPARESIDLPDLICHTLASFQSLSQERSLHIETDLPPDKSNGLNADMSAERGSVEADSLFSGGTGREGGEGEEGDGKVEAPRVHLEMLTRNLIENALRYTPEGGRVTIRVTTGAGGVELEIHNDYPTGAGLDCGPWFEPFYRPEVSRNLYGEGNGLGLAICKAIAVANRWQLGLKPENQSIIASVLFSTTQT